MRNNMSMSVSQINFNNTITPPRGVMQLEHGCKFNNYLENKNRHTINETNLNLAQSAFISRPIM
jgi:hypothetical protein